MHQRTDPSGLIAERLAGIRFLADAECELVTSSVQSSQLVLGVLLLDLLSEKVLDGLVDLGNELKRSGCLQRTLRYSGSLTSTELSFSSSVAPVAKRRSWPVRIIMPAYALVSAHVCHGNIHHGRWRWRRRGLP
jgi:hypothetical protein